MMYFSSFVLRSSSFSCFICSPFLRFVFNIHKFLENVNTFLEKDCKFTNMRACVRACAFGACVRACV